MSTAPTCQIVMIEMVNIMTMKRVMVASEAAVIAKAMSKAAIIRKTVPVPHTAEGARGTPHRSMPGWRGSEMWRRIRLYIVTGKQKQRTEWQ